MAPRTVLLVECMSGTTPPAFLPKKANVVRCYDGNALKNHYLIENNGLKKILLQFKVTDNKIQITKVMQNAHYFGARAGL